MRIIGVYLKIILADQLLFTVWSNIASTLDTVMKGIKAYRLRRERDKMCAQCLMILDEVLREFGYAQPRGYIAPRGVDLALLESSRLGP